jgi:cbb3-type cytochrome oxidase maturation protein
MEEYQLAISITTFLIFLIFLGFLIWGIKSGQFKDVEAPKYRMLRRFDLSEKETEKEVK